MGHGGTPITPRIFLKTLPKNDSPHWKINLLSIEKKNPPSQDMLHRKKIQILQTSINIC